MCQHVASTAGQDPRKRQFGLHSSGGKEGVWAPPSTPPLRRRARQHPHRCQLLRVALGARSRGCQHVGQCCAGRHHSRDGPVGRASTQGDWLTRQYRQDDDFVACLACMPLHIRHPTLNSDPVPVYTACLRLALLQPGWALIHNHVNGIFKSTHCHDTNHLAYCGRTRQIPIELRRRPCVRRNCRRCASSLRSSRGHQTSSSLTYGSR